MCRICVRCSTAADNASFVGARTCASDMQICALIWLKWHAGGGRVITTKPAVGFQFDQFDAECRRWGLSSCSVNSGALLNISPPHDPPVHPPPPTPPHPPPAFLPRRRHTYIIRWTESISHRWSAAKWTKWNKRRKINDVKWTTWNKRREMYGAKWTSLVAAVTAPPPPRPSPCQQVSLQPSSRLFTAVQG